MTKIVCISNRLGAWDYDVKIGSVYEFNPSDGYYDTPSASYFGDYRDITINGVKVKGVSSVPKSLFITMDEHRNRQLDVILNG